mmetsp:Transcript_60919/g.125514  ORF Transcript_60919/g.125514 Transcript_60919/m.125514 type:complete len:214 (-) Transcript_60919:1811-2452(-)
MKSTSSSSLSWLPARVGAVGSLSFNIVSAGSGTAPNTIPGSRRISSAMSQAVPKPFTLGGHACKASQHQQQPIVPPDTVAVSILISLPPLLCPVAFMLLRPSLHLYPLALLVLPLPLLFNHRSPLLLPNQLHAPVFALLPQRLRYSRNAYPPGWLVADRTLVSLLRSFPTLSALALDRPSPGHVPCDHRRGSSLTSQPRLIAYLVEAHHLPLR